MVHVHVNPARAMGPADRTDRTPAGFAFALGCLAWVFLASPRLPDVRLEGSVGLLALMAGVPFWFLASAARRHGFFGYNTIMIVVTLVAAIIFLSFWSLLSSLSANAPLRAGRTFMGVASGAAILLLVHGTLTERRALFMIGLIVGMLALGAIASAVSGLNPALHDFFYLGTDRAHGFFKNPNQFGMILATFLPITLALVMARKRAWLWILASVAIFAGLVLAGSKSNLLLASSTTLAFLLIHSFVTYTGATRFAVAAMLLAVGIGIIGAAIAGLAIFNPRALALLDLFLTDASSIPSLNSRGLLWRDSVSIFIDNPMTGQGAGQPLEVWLDGQTISHSHNVFLEFGRTMGMPGLAGIVAIYAAAIFLFLRSIYAALVLTSVHPGRRNLCVGLALGGLSYLFANLASDSFGPSTSPFFWLVVFLCAAFSSEVYLEAEAT